jgi:hypothetical protein
VIPDRPLPQRGLSPAAQQALEAVSEEFKEQVLWVASITSSVSATTRELTVGDIVRAAEEVLNARTVRRERSERLGLAYLAMGTSLALASIIVLLLLISGKPSAPSQLIAAVAGATGAVTAGLGAMTMALGRRSLRLSFGSAAISASFVDPTGLFMSRWLDFEAEARKVVADELGESRANVPLAQVIQRLVDAGYLTSDDMASARQVLDLRNKVAHGRADLTTEDAEAALKTLNSLQGKLQSARSAGSSHI